MTNFLNIYPWFFFFFLILGQGVQAYKVHQTKKTDGLSAFTFFFSLSASTLFGITCLIGGEYSFALLISNCVSVVLISYILYHIITNKGNKKAWILPVAVISYSLVIIVLGTINYVGFVSSNKAIIDVNNPPSWLAATIPTLGGIFSASIFIPQFVKILITKETRYLHYLFMFFFSFYLVNIVIFWLLFGINTGNWHLASPTIVFSGLGIIVQVMVVYLKVKYEARKKYI